MYEVTTYPPSPSTSTTVPPPSSPTAFTGSTSDIPAIGGVVLILSVVAALALRIGSKRAKRLSDV